MKKIIKVILPVVVIVAAIFVSKTWLGKREKPTRQAPQKQALVVSAIPLLRQDFDVSERTRGSVQPRTQGTLVAQVAGQVVSVGENFRAGGFFEKGEELLRIDDRDYAAAVTIAQAELAQARLALADEQARSAQALRDWQRLNLGGQPSDLTLRKPQLAGAKASVAAARARLTQANLNKERTRIVAPYAGRVMAQQVDIGEFVGAGSPLAEIYASDVLEVRLPLTARQLQNVRVPTHYRDGDVEAGATPVVLSVQEGARRWEWQARLVRTEGVIDAASRQTFVVAQVNDPYAKTDNGRPPLKVGQFVEARIAGVAMKNVWVIPRAALHEPNTIWLATPDNTLRAETLQVAWRGPEQVVGQAQIAEGERLVTSALAVPSEGTPIRVQGDPPPAKRAAPPTATATSVTQAQP